jgi:ATP-dependent DNA ligase
MFRFEFCLPTTGKVVPSAPEWFHEIKYDGFRIRLERDGDRVRLITRGGYDWTKRYPWIVEAALKNRRKHFVIYGEAVILGADGVSDFNALHSGRYNSEVRLCAFDVLALDGEAAETAGFKNRHARVLGARPLLSDTDRLCQKRPGQSGRHLNAIAPDESRCSDQRPLPTPYREHS